MSYLTFGTIVILTLVSFIIIGVIMMSSVLKMVKNYCEKIDIYTSRQDGLEDLLKSNFKDLSNTLKKIKNEK